MARSIAKADATMRDLKDRLELRGFSVAESRDGNGWPKLTLDTDEASLRIEAEDAVSKDIFGNDIKAYTPHYIDFASRDDAMSSLKVSKILQEVGKIGMKMVVKTHATVLATAEAAAGEEIEFDALWPTKGM